jgi:GNAT superfamily N-acetyltransferase
MSETVTIEKAETSQQIEAARRLFREYEAWLGLDLCFQGFEDELTGLPGKYAPPHGRLFLAYVGDSLAGCIALRAIGDGDCEMKRLFVKKEFRGRHLGQKLIETLLREAREIGYKTIKLDTYPQKMGKAVDLYRSYGFEEIPAYYSNPHNGVLFLELDLSQ